jgi:hypothetical protein
MKSRAIKLMTALCCVAAFGQARTAEDDPHWTQQIVKRAFDEVSAGLRTSWSERYLGRLGDSAAPAIMKLISIGQLTNQDAETAVTLAKMSFADPRSIKRSPDKSPTKTLALLSYLDKHVTDADVKSKIGSVRKQLKARACGPNVTGLCTGVEGISLQLRENASRSLRLCRHARGPSTPKINSRRIDFLRSG